MSMIRQNTIFWQKQTAPRCVIKTHVAVQKEKIGRRAIIYTIISRCSDAHSHLIFERNDGIRTGYAPEAESRTWSSRLLFFCSAAKVKNNRIKFQIFHFTFTSLDFTLSLPDFTLRYLSHCNPDN